MSRPARLDAPQWRERREALQEAAALGAGFAVGKLLAALGDRASGVRVYAINSLRDFGDEVVEPLLDAVRRGHHPVWCAAVLANCEEGRYELQALPQHGEALLAAALRDDQLPVRIRIGVTKAIVICEGEEVGPALEAALSDPSVMIQYAAGRALWARRDRHGVRWVIQLVERAYLPQVEMLEWLGEACDPDAIPLLKRLASVWRTPFLPGKQRAAARASLQAIEDALAHIPEGALSLAPRPSGVTDAALSLWREGETEDERQA